MSELTRAVALSGALGPDQLQELMKWRLPVELPEDQPYETAAEAVGAIEDALTSENQVEVRVTDLEVLRAFLSSKQEATMHVFNEQTKQRGSWPIQIGHIQRLKLVEYIIPWRGDAIEDLLTNGETYVVLRGSKQKIYFSRVQDCYFGEQKVFIICTPNPGSNGKSG